MIWIPFLAAQLAAPLPDTLAFGEFFRRVAASHPVARQARLLDTIAVANERTARGAFDPKLSAAWDRKQFGGRTYFDYVDAALTVPTTLGVDVKVGFERARGEFIAGDRRTPGPGLLTAGLSFPIGQRLLTDERRVALSQARAMRDYAAGERDALVNKLLSTATAVYADWYAAHQGEQVAGEAVRIGEFRLNALRQRVVQGDAAAIDTLEALLELQRRRVQLEEARLARQNASILVEGMLWDERSRPLALPPDARPRDVGAQAGVADSARVPDWIAAALRAHPDLRKATAKVREQEVALALARQRVFVPDLTASVSGLAAGNSSALFTEAVRAGSDTKVGASLELPLLLRKERGKLAAVDGKVDQLELERALTRRGVTLTIEMAVNELRTLDSLVALQAATVEQARRLRDGEQRKFDAGESTLFLVTARERLVLDEELKRIALQAKRLAAVGKLSVAIGMPVVP